MAYTRNPTWKDWPDKTTLVTAAALENIETGIQDAATTADSAASGLTGKADLAHVHTEADVTGLVSDLAGKAPTVHTHIATDVSDSTSVGRAILTAADAAAARAVIGAGTASVTVLDEDDMASNSATNPPSQQSVKAYVDSSAYVRTINPQTGTSYTFVLADDGRLVTGDNTSPQTFTIPADLSTNFPVGSRIDILALGTGVITLAPQDGTVTIRTSRSLVLDGQNAAATLEKIAANTWYAAGDLVDTGGDSSSPYTVTIPYMAHYASATASTYAFSQTYYLGGYHYFTGGTDTAGSVVYYPIRLAAGTYSVSVHTANTTSSGIIDVKIGATVIGSIDTYAAASAPGRTVITGISLTEGERTVSLVVNGKNASSTGYRGYISAIILTRTGA